MAYVSQIISDDEKMLALVRVHWFYAFQGLLWFLAPLLLWGGIESYVFFSPALSKAPMLEASFGVRFWVFAGFTLGGFVLFVLSVMHYLHTELALTDRRVVYKTHWIFVDIRETDLEEIKAAHVDNDWAGRFLDYGHVLLDARFVGNMQLYTIAHAYDFVKGLNKAREAVRKDSMKVVLDEGRAEAATEIQVLHHNTDGAQVHAGGPDTHLSPMKRKRLHDRILESFSLTNWRKEK